jgi:hypothetical protein
MGGGEGGSTDAGISLFYRISSSLGDGTTSDNSCYGRLAVVSDLDGWGFALNVDKELRGSAVL